MPRDWQSVVDQLTDVQKLVHLAHRYDIVTEQEMRTSLLAMRRQSYNDELTNQAARVGCPNRRGDLRNGDILTTINEMCETDAASIVNTYNYDLAVKIMQLGAENPRGNRYFYAARLRTWEQERAQWKDVQIAQYTDASARAKALQDFTQFNGAMGTAVLQPTSAVCPVCQGWITRGEVPLREATNDPPPYHLNCPHYWDTYPDRWPKGECDELWMGQ